MLKLNVSRAFEPGIYRVLVIIGSLPIDGTGLRGLRGFPRSSYFYDGFFRYCLELEPLEQLFHNRVVSLVSHIDLIQNRVLL